MAQIMIHTGMGNFVEIETVFNDLKARIDNLESENISLQEAVEHLSDGLESAKKQIKLLEEGEIKKTTSLFQTLIEALHLKPKSRIKETIVNLDERNQV